MPIDARNNLLAFERKLHAKQQRIAAEMSAVQSRLPEAIADWQQDKTALVHEALAHRPGDLATQRHLSHLRVALQQAYQRLLSIDAAKAREGAILSPGRAAERAEALALGRKVLWLLDNWARLGTNERAALALLPLVRERFNAWHPDGLPEHDTLRWHGKALAHVDVDARKVARVYADAGGEMF